MRVFDEKNSRYVKFWWWLIAENVGMFSVNLVTYDLGFVYVTSE